MPNKILRFEEVQERTGFSRSTIYNRINPNRRTYDPTFPKPISLGPRLLGWLESEIDQWIEETVLSCRQVINQ